MPGLPDNGEVSVCSKSLSGTSITYWNNIVVMFYHTKLRNSSIYSDKCRIKLMFSAYRTISGNVISATYVLYNKTNFLLEMCPDNRVYALCHCVRLGARNEDQK